ncbi:transcription termination factor Rho [Klenkia taihuensis]|uniref:Transcription termination factor Rho n=1 Tax=Klenkia taihuensis TaxID=1225127 RepID=A0A1I1KML8_9ACTN|nr:transcription termination factor Rho [Klenkia taihuensis]GHE10369.1 hypothetical protein GCM10011381_19100 [Klenkia taihuensis]SFC58690.1 transcription termination factor Rho [Klenkia taihuensis]
MSETTSLVEGAPNEDAATGAGKRRRGAGLSGMLLPELQRLAAELGIPGTARMRKSDLVAAISERQVGAPRAAAPAESTPATSTPAGGESAASTPAAPVEAPAPQATAPGTDTASTGTASTDAGATDAAATAPPRRRRAASRPAGAPAPAEHTADAPADRTPDVRADGDRQDRAPQDRAEQRGADQRGADQRGAEQRDDEGGRPQRSRGRARTERADREDARDGREERTERTDRSERDDTDRDDRGGRTRTRNRGEDRDNGRDQSRDQGRDRDGARDQGRDGNRDTHRDRDDDRDAGRGQGRNDGQGRADNNQGRGDDEDRGDRGRNRNRTNDRGDRPDNRNDGRVDTRDQGRDTRDDEDDDDFDGNGRRRGRRYRDRNRRGGTQGGRDRYDQGEPTVAEDDVLLPVAGILDVLDNYAFVRTSGYLTGPNDVYVSLSQVRRYGLRRGDAITGAVRQPREGERKDKYNALVRLDSVNGLDPEQARTRPEFTKLVPLYPQDRLRLETEPHLLTTRVIDLVMPIGKGQRALIVSPPKAGKTMVLQAIANAITTNNPECHLMVVLVDERPEEVTDMQRSVKGEVIASTFDRPPSDHTTVAELSIERAKRLVEMGHDVVVLLDSITRLGRAYNLAAPASGRILSGGVDSTALYPPKRFLGAARNIENGGSLTIIASALVETGSTMDTVIFEEFKGTGNAEVKLDRRLADKRVFPAVDVNASSTRKEELLMSPDELAIVIKLRRVLAGLEPQQALELLLGQLKKTRNNIEFLMQVQKTTLRDEQPQGGRSS